jgi:hypothetical protein
MAGLLCEIAFCRSCRDVLTDVRWYESYRLVRSKSLSSKWFATRIARRLARATALLWRGFVAISAPHVRHQSDAKHWP